LERKERKREGAKGNLALRKRVLKEVFEWKFKTPSAFERRHGLDWWWCKKGSNHSNWARISMLVEFLYVCICSTIIFALYCINIMPLHDQNLSNYVVFRVSGKYSETA